MFLTKSSFCGIIYHAEDIHCTRLGEYKQLLSSERSGSRRELALCYQESSGWIPPCNAQTRRSNLCELETCIIDLHASNPFESVL